MWSKRLFTLDNMEQITNISLISFILLIIFLHKWVSGGLVSPRKRLPPSPWRLPIIGHLHRLGTLPHRSLAALSEHYGQLLLIHFGSVQVLVASSAQAAQEIMKDQDVVFASRPKSSIADRLFYRDVAFAPYGEHWRKARSISVTHLLCTERVKSYSQFREEESTNMVEKIKELGSSSRIVNLSDLFVSLTNNVVSRVALGRKYEYGSNYKKLNMLLRELLELVGTTVSFAEYIPYLGWVIDRVVMGLDAKIERVAKEFDELLETVIQEHKDHETRRRGDGRSDFVDILLQFQRDNKSNISPVEDAMIKGIIMDMFAAGTDTTSVTLEWATAELIKNPRTMKILQKEVRRVAGTKRENTITDEDDIEKMPYLKAVIKETLRLHPPLPLLVPHQSTRDTKVMGYEIPSGTRVFINAWAIGRDPSLWENPEEFCPERFLDSTVDYKGLHFELIPFGAGRRGCPGIAFAEAVVEIGLARLLHNFDIALPVGESEEDLDMSESSGITVRKKHPLLVIATPITASC